MAGLPRGMSPWKFDKAAGSQMTSTANVGTHETVKYVDFVIES